jgi:hypothetical protein
MSEQFLLLLTFSHKGRRDFRVKINLTMYVLRDYKVKMRLRTAFRKERIKDDSSIIF